MADWQEIVVTRLGPPITLCGITLTDWWRVMRDNHCAIDASYSLRAFTLTLSSLANSISAWFEERLYRSRIAKTDIKPPVFILGHWRSGTTHLQYLLARDQRLAFPNTYQVSYPRTFLTTEAMGARVAGIVMPPKRPMDDVRISCEAPNEDEFAICQMSFCSPYLGLTFPRRQSYYDQFLTLRGASAAAISRWKSALVHFLKKLTWKYNRPVVLKSPPHTCRIRLLLELFPNARFVHIHRNPYTVFQSTRRMIQASGPWFRLQRPTDQCLDERILRVFREMYDAFLEERGLIPQGRFHEVSYEELEMDPLAVMSRLYDALSLADFAEVEPDLAQYLSTLGGYRKNVFSELTPGLRERIASEWRPCFQEWGYAI